MAPVALEGTPFEADHPRTRATCAYEAVAAAAVDWGQTQETPITNPPPMTAASPIPLPDVDRDEPVAVIPPASVAPLDGRPDGDRINIYPVTPKDNDSALKVFAGDMRERVLSKPLTYVAIAFSLGLVIARVLR